MVVGLINLMSELNPTFHILHVPVTPPTLTTVPGLHFKAKDQNKFAGWAQRVTESMLAVKNRIGPNSKILVENINYSPFFLEFFWKSGICDFCLDMGHLMLDRESVSGATRQFMSFIKEIHLHGVIEDEDHLSLGVLPKSRVSQWVGLLMDAGFSGVVNLEVFSPEDLEASVGMLLQVIQFRRGLNGLESKG